MTTPVHQGFITGAYLPIIRETLNKQDTHILFKDEYYETFKKLGIDRDEMLVILPQMMRTDMLEGINNAVYRHKYKPKHGDEPIRLLITSDDLQNTSEEKINGDYKKFCVQHCDYQCAQDIGSNIFCKFEVAETDVQAIQSMTLFTGPRRSEEKNKEFWEIRMYKCWNLTPKELFEKMEESFESLDWTEHGKALVKEIIEKLK